MKDLFHSFCFEVYKVVLSAPTCFVIFMQSLFIPRVLDSVETAKREIEFFFPEFKYDKWLEKNGEKIQNGQIIYDEVSKTHKVLE